MTSKYSNAHKRRILCWIIPYVTLLHPQVLHISLKLAQIAQHLSQPKKAELGFQWVLEGVEEEMKNDANNQDFYELWGLAND